MNWRVGMLAREAMRNVFAIGARTTSILVAALILCGLSTVIQHIDDRALASDVGRNLRLGAYTIVFASAEQDEAATITAQSCSATAKMPGVIAAGPVEFLGSDRVAQLGSAVPIMATTPSLVPELGSASAVIGSELGITAQMPLAGQLLGTVTAVPGSDIAGGLPTSSAVAVRISTDLAATSACILVLDPRLRTVDAISVVQPTLSTSGGSIIGRAAYTPTVDPLDVYRQRRTRWLPMLIGLTLCAMAGLSLRGRSGELAVYRLSGTTRADLSTLLFLEQVLFAGVFVFAGCLAATITSSHLLSAQSLSVRTLQAGTAWLAFSPVLLLPAILRNPLTAAKDR